MNEVIAKYLNARVPRYTSYPTAPHFSDKVGEADMRGWLAGLSSDERLSLYLHVPFCRQMCWYCGCNMKLAARREPVSAYAGRLVEEIHLVADALPGRHTVSHIHWGGGTPTALAPEDFAFLDRALRERFDIAPDAEIAVETDPRTLSLDTVKALQAMGCNRASLGVQEFDETVQRAINRVQPFETVERVTGWLRGHGVAAINFDLMYGLPHQTMAMLAETVRRAVSLRPDRIALFGYAHVPWMAKNQRMIEDAALPDAMARFEMSEAAGDLIESLGYCRIGIDHFALPEDSLARAARSGRLRRNFQGYTADDASALIGFGASAISALPLGYAQNIVETGAYQRAVGEGRLPVAKGIRLDSDDELRRAIIERLMCDFSADMPEICTRYTAPPDGFGASFERLGPLVADGLVAIDGSRVTIPPEGRALTRVVAAAFDAYLTAASDAAPKRHAAL
jgi:oxygen-independent coproporphyrinogen-3 oxidase